MEKVVRSVAGRGKPRCHTFETWLCQDNSQLPTTQGTMRFLTGLLFLVFSLQEILSKDPVAVTKCCPASQIYNSAEKRCVQGAGNFFLPHTMNHSCYFHLTNPLNYIGESIIGKTIDVTSKTTPDPLTSDSVNPLENLVLTPATLQSKGTGLPGCAGLHHETHRLDAEGDSVLTLDGTLIVSKYENGVGENPGEFTTEFCVDL